ncbi:ricin-type beta-trefoil lectin domain protein [Streptomyces sp. NPDC001820]|uniref:ricin-type beta-trefoil lectin domain protein n=1 Tax=Streptomyces sp. NPDC001820 TaxID=3364613 RepID=UPI00368ACB5E
MPGRHRQQLSQRHPPANLDLHRSRQPEMDGDRPMSGQLLRRPVVRGLLGTAAAAALVTGLTSTPASGAAAATGQITGLGGKCVDVAGANSANGTAVQLYDCNGTGAQQWRASQTTTRPSRSPISTPSSATRSSGTSRG